MVVAEDNTDCYKAVGQLVVQSNIDLDIPIQKEVVDIVVPEINTINYEGFSCRTKGGGRGVRGEDYESFKRKTEQECEDRVRTFCTHIDLSFIRPIRSYQLTSLYTLVLSVLSEKRIAMDLNTPRVEGDNVRSGRRVLVLSRI